MVGRVWPRHVQRGRPLNAVVRHHRSGHIEHPVHFRRGRVMKEYTTSYHIAAAPARVWAVLVDAARYGDWNPEIVAIDGNIGPGQRITAHVRLGSGKVQKVGLRVTALDAPHLMEWTGGLPFGLFVGRRTFTVDSAASGCEFRLHLEMFGLLS